jgi:hypothetical protein
MSTMRTIKHWRNKFKTVKEGKTSHVHGLWELILWELLYYQKQFTDSMYSLSKVQWHSSQKYQKQKQDDPSDGSTNDLNSQSNPEQKEQCWRYQNTWLPIILQSHSNKNSMALTQKQLWRPVEQNRGSGNESTHLCSPYFWQRCQKHMMEKR